MKTSVSFLLLMPLIAFAHESVRVLFHKQLTRSFASVEEAAGWSLGSLPFADWLEAVLPGEGVLLHAEDQGTRYFAVFRARDHLVLWDTVRGEEERTAGRISVSAAGRPSGDPQVWFTFREMLLTHKLTFPGGYLLRQDAGSAIAIDPDFHGLLELHVKDSPDGGRPSVRFSAEILWAQDDGSPVFSDSR